MSFHYLIPLIFVIAACGPSTNESTYDPALEGLSVTAIAPGILLPGSELAIRGRSFVGSPWGTPSILFQGTFDTGTETHNVNFAHPADFLDLERLQVSVDASFIDRFGGAVGDFTGTVVVAIDSSIDGTRHTSAPLATVLSLRETLEPSLVDFQDTGIIFANERIELQAEGLLLGGNEGTTYARIEGCFTSGAGGVCVPVQTREIAISFSDTTIPGSEFDRTRGAFSFEPQIAGIARGEFVGAISLSNQHGSGVVRQSATSAITYQLREPELFSALPAELSLGKYLFLSGGGFVKTESSASTIVQIEAEFTPRGARPIPMNLTLIPEFIEGNTLRYTINEDDALGQNLDLRASDGILAGEIRTIVKFGEQVILSDPLPFSLSLTPVKQVVFLNFTTQYLDTLRSFGLRAMDSEIRERVAHAIRRDYSGINLDVRLSPPEDFSLFSTVEIGGKDPNGLGLLGYDNTPGKDSGNIRLHDYIGGVNAMTQQDGFPGYGGVFIDSLFVFSKHQSTQQSQLADSLFDDIFDIFRPDRDGEPVRSADLVGGLNLPTTAPICPASDRSEQIECATWTIANLIGSTISHEIGHSLGLANPNGTGSHHTSNVTNRIMDSGSARPFDERAELRGAGPAVFCTDAYEYLRTILPKSAAVDQLSRPSCL